MLYDPNLSGTLSNIGGDPGRSIVIDHDLYGEFYGENAAYYHGDATYDAEIEGEMRLIELGVVGARQ